ncbi:MAG: hypothetical protein HKL95_02110 [Phycisphaerae bacterium]|nr:hypothetical protein [Phycisphaerae bacterium]
MVISIEDLFRDGQYNHGKAFVAVKWKLLRKHGDGRSWPQRGLLRCYWIYFETPRHDRITRAKQCQTQRRLARLIVLLLAGAFVLLMLDIREEDLEPIKHGYLFPWIPIVYSGMMCFCCLVTFFRWRRPLRRMLMALFVLGIGVGLLGFWFHRHGHPLHAISVCRAGLAVDTIAAPWPAADACTIVFCGAGVDWRHRLR